MLVDVAVHRGHAGTMTGVDQHGPRAITSEAGHRRHVATTIAGGPDDRSAMGSMPAHRRLAATTTGPHSLVRRATDNPAARRIHAATIARPPTAGRRSGATTISEGNAPALRPAAQRERVTIAKAVADADQCGPSDRRVGTTIVVPLRRVRRPSSNVVTSRPVFRAAARVRVDPAALVGHGAVLEAVQAAQDEVQVARALRDGLRMRVQEGRRVAHGRERVDRDQVGRDRAHGVTIRRVETEVPVTDRRMTIAIDGPGAAGKSTVGEIVARRIDAIYFDTGVLYRALTLLALERGVAPSDATRLARLAETMDIRVGLPTVDDGRQVDVLLSGRDVTHDLRTPEIDRNVSAVSAHAAVRAALLEQQRRIGRSGRVVMVGRDIGTVVLPDAELKIFLDASPEERARRRYQQLEEMGQPQPYEAILADMRRRDRIDSERDIAPLRPADDAIIIDSDALTIEEVADLIVSHVEQLHESVH